MDSEAVRSVPRVAMPASRQRICPVTLGFYPFEKHAAVQAEEERMSHAGHMVQFWRIAAALNLPAPDYSATHVDQALEVLRHGSIRKTCSSSGRKERMSYAGHVVQFWRITAALNCPD